MLKRARRVAAATKVYQQLAGSIAPPGKPQTLVSAINHIYKVRLGTVQPRGPHLQINNKTNSISNSSSSLRPINEFLSIAAKKTLQ